MREKSIMKRGIQLIIPLITVLTILTLLASQSPRLQAQSLEINLIDNKHIWKPFYDATVSQNQSNLNIVVVTANNNTIYSRAFLPIQIALPMNKSLTLTLAYESQSNKGNATFAAEIRDNTSGIAGNGSKILWHDLLDNTNGQLMSETHKIPNSIVNRPVELRLYVISNGPGEHILDVKNASILIH